MTLHNLLARGTCVTVAVFWVLAASACGDDVSDGGNDGGDAGTSDAFLGRCVAAADCSDGRFCNGVERCDPTATAADSRGCVAGALPCGSADCDESATMCIGACDVADADGDGRDAVACGGDDCDDADAARFPGNPEVCDDGHDEDCNASTYGDRDLDADGVVDHLCCNDDGGVSRCGDDCDDSAAGTYPGATEICNAVDEDCDALVDDVTPGIAACIAGSVVPCTTVCGVLGTRSCRTDCVGYDVCVASAEECNGCDDDNDGAVDNGFECPRGTIDACLTACGTAGQRICNTSCVYVSGCAATAEICNFCDDNLLDGFNDEKALATSDTENVSLNGGRYAGAAFSWGVAESSPSRTEVYAQLLSGTIVNEAGAYWIEIPRRVGWGRIEIVATLEARVIRPAMPGPEDVVQPLGGWSVVLSSGGVGDVGAASNRGIPAGISGIAFDWFWSRAGMSDPTPYPGDGMRYRSLTRGARGASPSDSEGEDIVNANADLEGDGAWVTQNVVIEYQPDDPSTPTANEEHVSFIANGGPSDFDASTAVPPNRDLPVGSTLRIGFTAGSYSRVFTPPGGPALTFGAPVEARIRLYTVTPRTSGPGADYVYHATISQLDVCPGSL